MRRVIDQRAAKLRWSPIRFLGFKNESGLTGYYDPCDVFVLSSAYEQWGLVVNEIMNAGRAVVNYVERYPKS